MGKPKGVLTGYPSVDRSIPVNADSLELEVKVVLAFTPQDLLQLSEDQLDHLHHAINNYPAR